MRRPLRVLLLTHNCAGYGGSYIRSFSLARQLAALGQQVTLMAAPAVPRPTFQISNLAGVRLIQPPDLLAHRLRHGGLSPLELAGRLALVARERFDIVHGFDHRPSVSLPALAAQRCGARFVSDWADLWGLEGIASTRPAAARWSLGLLDDLAERLLRRYADGATVASSYLGLLLNGHGPAPAHTLLLPPGANHDQIVPMPQQAMRVRHGLPPHGPVVVSIGYSHYDSALLVATLERLNQRMAGLLLLTTGFMPPWLLGRLRAVGQLRHMGQLAYAQLGEILACGDLMLLPYTSHPLNWGRFPSRVGDYLAAGRPIVTNPTADLGRLVRDEQVGLATAEQPEAMADAVCSLIERPELGRELGARGRQLAETRLAWRTLAAQVAELYSALV